MSERRCLGYYVRVRRRWPDPAEAGAQHELGQALHDMHNADTSCFHGNKEPDCVMEARWLLERLGEPRP